MFSLPESLSFRGKSTESTSSSSSSRPKRSGTDAETKALLKMYDDFVVPGELDEDSGSKSQDEDYDDWDEARKRLPQDPGLLSAAHLNRLLRSDKTELDKYVQRMMKGEEEVNDRVLKRAQKAEQKQTFFNRGSGALRVQYQETVFDAEHEIVAANPKGEKSRRK
ncbi:hypothetical protein EJ04DRAFT_561838 [Polyplosphaeria fusca]|uniref:Uncharacterized protein n=1 Tax=Polyplosphaeria fusca TaxID=682080 RepID=A0A9P4V2A0_9PLEO|nr:hypothetical protein EJ04DRAFT_561838 [Polyplosphaeria fusca]